MAEFTKGTPAQSQISPSILKGHLPSVIFHQVFSRDTYPESSELCKKNENSSDLGFMVWGPGSRVAGVPCGWIFHQGGCQDRESQGYLTDEKSPSCLEPPCGPRQRSTVGCSGGAVSHERGTPAVLTEKEGGDLQVHPVRGWVSRP